MATFDVRAAYPKELAAGRSCMIEIRCAPSDDKEEAHISAVVAGNGHFDVTPLGKPEITVTHKAGGSMFFTVLPHQPPKGLSAYTGRLTVSLYVGKARCGQFHLEGIRVEGAQP